MIEEFFEKYEKKELENILAQLFFETSSYPLEKGGSTFEKAFYQYIDALVFADASSAFSANMYLQSLIDSKQLEIDALSLKSQALEMKSMRDQFSLQALNTEKQNLQQILKTSKSQIDYAKQSQYLAIFKEKKPSFVDFLEQEDLYFSLPNTQFLHNSYDLVTLKKEPAYIFINPLNVNWESILKPIENIPCCFLFDSSLSFLKSLSSEYFLSLVSNPIHSIIILSLYANRQIQLQPRLKSLKAKNLYIFGLEKRFDQELKEMIKLINKTVSTNRKALQNDLESADLLYKKGVRLFETQKRLRLGPLFYPALYERFEMKKWYDVHKNRVDDGIKEFNYLKNILNNYPKTKSKKYNHRKKRIAHITPQLVDVGHSPTKLLKTLLLENSQFESFVFCTERLLFRGHEYPYSYFGSPPSHERGHQTVQWIKEKSIPLFIDDGNHGFLKSAEAIAKKLDELEIDIALFHGVDVINQIAAKKSHSHLKVCFEHGSLPTEDIFDLLIVSTKEIEEEYKNFYHNINTEIVALPFGVEAHLQWDKNPYPKSKFNVPENSLILTTISNHLTNRLGNEMCDCIAQILQAVDHCYYAPIGQSSKELQERFKRLGVYDRIRFLGMQDNPSQWARSTTLYLNEFPFGSCLGMIDAMASGVPPLSLYDPKGPPQSRYGAAYFDKQYTVSSKQEYIDMAIKLLQNQVLYQQWSQKAKECYNRQADIKRYVQSFEKILNQSFKKKNRVLITT